MSPLGLGPVQGQIGLGSGLCPLASCVVLVGLLERASAECLNGVSRSLASRNSSQDTYMFLEHELAMGKVGQPGGWEVVQSSSMCPISVEPWAECGPSWDLGPRAPVCSGGGPDTVLRLSRRRDPSFQQTQ